MKRPLITRRHAAVAALGLGAVLVPAAGAWAVTIVNGVVIGKDGWLFLVFDDTRQGQSPRSQQVTRLMAEATALIRAGGMECAVLVTPSKARIYAEFLPDDWQFNAESHRRYEQGLEALRAGGALVPDLARLMLAHRRANPSAALFFRNDTHWTPAAAELAARELAGLLARQATLPRARGPAVRLGAPVQVPGSENDLLNLLPAAERGKYQVEPFPIRRPLRETGRNALVEEDHADIAVVGNSFAQPKFNLAPALSAEMGRPVSLAWDNHLKGPFKVLLTYLQSPGFRRQRPRVIVWNIIEQDLALLPSDTRAFPANAMSPEEFLSGIRRALT